MNINFDPIAAIAAAAASTATVVLLRDAFRPFPTGTPSPPIDFRGGGIKALLQQHLYEIVVNNETGDYYTTWSRKWDRDVFGVHIFRSQRMAVTHPDDIEYIFVEKPKEFNKEGILYRIVETVVGNGLVAMKDEDAHTLHRRVCNPAFGPKPLRNIANGTIREHTMTLAATISKRIAEVKQLEHQSTSCDGCCRMSINDAICLTTLRIIAAAAFHLDEEDLEAISDQFMTATKDGFNPIRFLPVLSRLPLPQLRKAKDSKRRVEAFAKTLCQKHKERLSDAGAAGTLDDNDGGSSKALLDMLVRSGGKLTDEEIALHCITFMFAGHETTSNTMQFLLAELSRRPDVQEKLFEELESVLGKHACPPADALETCEYLNCVIKEALRMYPAAPIIGRNCVKDDVLPGSRRFVPKGMACVVSIFTIQRDPKLYGPDADDFRPERWEGGELDASLHTCAFMPFSIGKRNCIGKDLAMFELQILTAVLLRNFKFSFPGDVPFPRRKFTLTMRPEKDFDLLIAERPN